MTQARVAALTESSDELDYTSIPDLWESWTTESRQEFLQKIVHDCQIGASERGTVPLQDRVSLDLCRMQEHRG